MTVRLQSNEEVVLISNCSQGVPVIGFRFLQLSGFDTAGCDLDLSPSDLGLWTHIASIVVNVSI